MVPQIKGTILRSPGLTRDWMTSPPCPLPGGGSGAYWLKAAQRPSGEIDPAPLVIDSSAPSLRHPAREAYTPGT